MSRSRSVGGTAANTLENSKTPRSRSSSRSRTKKENTSTKKTSSAKKSGAGTKKRSTSRGRSPSRKVSSPVKKTEKADKKKPSPSPAKKKASPSPTPQKKANPPKSPNRSAVSSDDEIDHVTIIKTKKVVVTDSPVHKGSRASIRLMEQHDHIACTLDDHKNRTDTKIASGKGKHHLYGGPIGTTIFIVLLPTLVYILNVLCNPPWTIHMVYPSKNWRDYCYYADIKSAGICLVWIFLQVLLALVPIGPLVRDTRRSQHRCNGFLSLFVSLAGLACLIYWKKVPVSYVTDHYMSMIFWTIKISFEISLFLYFKAKWAPRSALNSEANTGCWPYDFFVGQETNPRILRFDFKFFLCRFCLISWAMIDILFYHKYYTEFKVEPNAIVNNLTPVLANPALFLVTFFHLLYIVDFFIFEKCQFTTYNYSHESVGFMMVVGGLTFFPFVYSLTVRFLSQNIMKWSPLHLAGFTALNMIGLIIYRGSNWQKDKFRRDPHHPSLSNLVTIPTSTSKRLLVSGWWGFLRHPNYLGDILMSIAWSMPAGCGLALPWFYPAMITLFLIGQTFTVEKSCEKKYGNAWRNYKQRVPYRLIPYVF